VRWAIAPLEPSPARPSSNAVRAFVHWPAWRRADPTTLVAGVRQAVANGCDLSVDVVGGLGDGPSGFHRWLAFQDQIDSAKLTPRFRLHGDLSPMQRNRVMNDADLVVWIGRSIEGAGLPDTVVEGLAVGKPVVASAVREITWLPALAENIELVAPADAEALATALRRFASDRESAARRLAAGRAILSRRAIDDTGRTISEMLSAPGPG